MESVHLARSSINPKLQVIHFQFYSVVEHSFFLLFFIFLCMSIRLSHLLCCKAIILSLSCYFTFVLFVVATFRSLRAIEHYTNYIGNVQLKQNTKGKRERERVSEREMASAEEKKKTMNEMKPLLPLANVSRCCKASIKCELLLSIHFNRNVCVQCASLPSQCILFHPLSIYLSDYSQSGKMKICYYRRAVDALGINHRTV